MFIALSLAVAKFQRTHSGHPAKESAHVGRVFAVNYLEVLTTQQSLLSARQAWAQDKCDEIQSVISLYYALGGGN